MGRAVVRLLADKTVQLRERLGLLTVGQVVQDLLDRIGLHSGSVENQNVRR